MKCFTIMEQGPLRNVGVVDDDRSFVSDTERKWRQYTILQTANISTRNPNKLRSPVATTHVSLLTKHDQCIVYF